MSKENFIKNITSKNIELSQNTIKELIKSANIEDFEELCEKSDFIFPFLKERIIKDFVKLINKENLKTVFEFSKIYCEDFEDLIVNSWTKFANEDLTDEILELFEKGTDEQKSYCAKYFSLIQDSCALDLLIKNAKSSFLPLKINCANTLKIFKDKTVLTEMKNIVLKSQDDFEKLEAYEFLCAYGENEQITFILDNCFSSPFVTNIISNLLNYNDIKTIKNTVEKETFCRIFEILIMGYPEDITLDTIQYYQIYDFISDVYEINNQYAKNLLLLLKAKFNEFNQNDIYLFDLDKNIKNELVEITGLLNSFKLDFNEINEELNPANLYRYNIALEVIKEYHLEQFSDVIADLINTFSLPEELIAQSIQTMKALAKITSVDFEIVENIKNENIKALAKSYIV